MDKFCTKCGNQLNEGDVFCSNCGSKTDNDQAAVTNAPQSSEGSAANPQPSESSAANPQQPSFSTGGMANTAFAAPGKKRKKALIIGISAAAVAVLAAGAVLLCYLFGIFGSRGYKAAINNVLRIDEVIFNEGFDGIEDKDIRSLAPDALWDYIEQKVDMDFDETAEIIRDNMSIDEDDCKSIANSYGGNIRISYNITDSEHLSSAAVSDLADKFHSQYNIAKNTVTDAYKVKCTLSFKGDTGEKDGNTNVYCVKIDGKWYVCDSSFRFTDVITTCIHSFGFFSDLY